MPRGSLLLSFGVDAKYAKHLKVFGEMCVVADANNKVGRTKINPRGKTSLFVGYSTQHVGETPESKRQVELSTVEMLSGLVKHGQNFTRLK